MKHHHKSYHRLIALLLCVSLAFGGCSFENFSKISIPGHEKKEKEAEIAEEKSDENEEQEAADRYRREVEEEKEKRQSRYVDIDIASLTGKGGKPWADTDLKSNIRNGLVTSPRDDFHLYANYDWLQASTIPEGYQAVSPFGSVQTQTTRRAEELLSDTSLSGHDAGLVQSLYNAILDWNTRDALGIEPIRPTVADIESISSMDGLCEFVCDPERSYRVPVFLSIRNQTDYTDSTHYITTIVHDPFTLGDAAEYVNRTDQGRRYYEAYKTAAKRFLTRLGYSEEEAEAKYEAMIDFETKLAEVSLTDDDKLDADVYEEYMNYYSPKKMKKLAKNFPLTRFLISFGFADAKKFMVLEPKELKRLDELFIEDNLESIKAYMLIGYVFQMCMMLDGESYQTVVDLMNEIQGTTGRQSDKKVAFDTVRTVLTTPMDRAYLSKYDASKLKTDVTKICESIIASYRNMIKNETWLSAETKKAAMEKLDNMNIRAVYPSKWRDYSSLDLTGKNYPECIRAIDDYDIQYERTLTNGTVDRELWDADILEANAYYSQMTNSISIIYGVLGDVFYNENMTDEQMYGGIGMIIAHEISHAFDTTGARFDKDGNYNIWWKDADYDAFLDRADKLVAYYDGIIAMDNVPINGANIQSEAIADMAGLKAVLLLAEDNPDFDYAAFFEQYAHIWRRLDIIESEINLIMNDEHPLGYLRTNVTLQQFDKFYEVFDVKEGDGMYLAPENRINVW